MDAPFLNGGGELGRLIAGFDWSRTGLGPLAGWSSTLKTTTGLILRSPVPIVTLWGEEGWMIYNDAYSGFAGGRHPRLLGSKVREGWPEVAEFNDNVMKVGLAGGTLAYQDQELTLHRSGAPEQVWMNLDYSPIIDEAGRPVGVIAIVVETTAKVRAERWLSGERERLRTMFEQAPGFMHRLMGPDLVYDMANPAYIELIGGKDIIGRPVRDALPELEDQGFFETLEAVFRTGRPFSGLALPVRLRPRGEGPTQERFIDVAYQPIRDQAGQIIGVFGQGADVTDRVLAERQVRASEAQFKTFAQVMPNLVWASAPSGEVQWFNDGVYSYSGGTPETLLGDGWRSLVHPDELGAVSSRWSASLASGAPYEMEFRLRRFDGAWRWQLARALPIRDDGAITGWVGAITDIEDQKAALHALAHLNETLEAQVAERTAERDRMWRLSTDLMLVADFGGRILSVNPASTRMLGWAEGELVGANLLELIHPDDLAATVAEIGSLSQGRTTLRFENRYRTKDGGYLPVAWTAVPDSSLIHAVGRDVSREKAALAELEQAHEALRQAQKMEAVGQLTGGIAHDFNNLLTGIIGSLDLMQRRLQQGRMADLERYATAAMTSANRAAALTHRLLAFSRRQPLDPKPVNANRLVTGMEELLRRTIGETVKLEIVTAGGLWQTLCDPHQLENAVLNLAINGRDAMPQGGTLTIETCNAHLDTAYAASSRGVRPGQYICICVTDTGTGMTQDVIDKAFDPFFTTKPIGQGTGLGLSMIYGFARQSEGYAKIYSEVGKGTTVKLYLPRHYGDAEAGETDRGGLADPQRSAHGEVVLVVEDESAVRALVVDVLEELGYRAVEAEDGPSGLRLIQSSLRIDLLVTDVGLPGLNGRQLADAARTTRPDLKVLFMTGYAENAAIAGGFLEPGMEMMTKPFAIEALAQRIRGMIDGRTDG